MQSFKEALKNMAADQSQKGDLAAELARCQATVKELQEALQASEKTKVTS